MFAHASLTCLRYQILELTKENLLIGLLQCDKQKLSLTWAPAWTWETQLESSLINVIQFISEPYLFLISCCILLEFSFFTVIDLPASFDNLSGNPRKKPMTGEAEGGWGIPWIAMGTWASKHGSVSCALGASLCQVLFDSVFQGDAVPDSDLLADHHPAVLHCVCNQR